MAEFGDKSQKAEQQAVCSSLILLLVDLKDSEGVNAIPFPTDTDWANGSTHVFVIFRVDLFLQQRQQVVRATGKLLLLHLHVQAADLSPEAPQVGLGGLNKIQNHLRPTNQTRS